MGGGGGHITAVDVEVVVAEVVVVVPRGLRGEDGEDPREEPLATTTVDFFAPVRPRCERRRSRPRRQRLDGPRLDSQWRPLDGVLSSSSSSSLDDDDPSSSRSLQTAGWTRLGPCGCMPWRRPWC